MQNLQTSMDKLNALLSTGVISQDEFSTKRQNLVDHFVGLPNDTAAPAPAAGAKGGGGPMRGGKGKGAYTSYATPHYHPYGGGGKGYGKGFGKGLGGKGFGGKGFGGKGFGGKGGKGFGKGASKEGSTTVKIQPVPAGLTSDQLTELFSAYGEVTSSVINAGNPPYGYINFATADAAKAAASTERLEIAGEMALLTLGKKRTAPQELAPPSNGIGLFNLPFSITYEGLQEMLQAYAGFSIVKMVYRKSGEFRGYAFAYFDTIENATVAKDCLQGMAMEHLTIDVKFSSKSAEDAMAGPVA